MDDINLFYYGASGGFYLMHQLLLTEQLHCNFGRYAYDSFVEGSNRAEQFANFVTNNNDWKHREHWPNNDKTMKDISTKRKLYFTCSEYEEWIKLPGKKLFLYTDYKTQIRLASTKKAHWYYQHTPTISELKNYINKKKGDLINEVYFVKKYTEKNNGITVTWQDIITEKGLQNVFEKLDLQINENNISFIKKYINLHPKVLLSKLNIS